MKPRQIMTLLLLMLLGGAVGVQAQTYIVAVGDQVMTESDVENNGLYALYNPRNAKCMYEDSSNKLLLLGGLSLDGLNGSTTTNAIFRLISNGDGTYKIQNYDSGRYLPAPTADGGVSTSETAGNYALNFQSDGNMFPRCTNNGATYGLDHTSADGVFAFTNVNTTVNGAQNYQLYKITLSEYVEPEGISVVTLNNTTSGRGALIYNPSASEKWVWSSGKSGTFSSSSANSQWVFYPTGSPNEYYLYNLGAQKFVVPTQDGTFNGYSWMFSHDAVAMTLSEQSDGTYKIFTATGGLCLSVSNNYEGPIINCDDEGAQFTMTKLTEISEAQTQKIEAAIGKLIHNTPKLSALPSSDGWYAIIIKSGDYAGKAVYVPESEIQYQTNRNYPLTFMHDEVNQRPSISNSVYYTRIVKTDNGYTWQLPNGKYLKKNTSNFFPTSTTEIVNNVSVTYSSNGMQFIHGSYKAVPYLLSSKYFIGETSGTGGYFDVYPIDLSTAGLTAWQVLCDEASEGTLITCSRTDVSGLASVYKNGYFFLPTGVTPTASDFSLNGSTRVDIDATSKTITFSYDPNLAIVDEGVSVEQGYQTAAVGGEVMLLRVTASPFKSPSDVTMNIALKDDAEANISKLTLYEASSDSPEILSTGTGAPTKKVVAEAAISGSTATLSIDGFTAGNHYYWLAATVKDDATPGAIIDAAVTGITYTCNATETTLDLTSTGDPADRGAMVFDVHSYPFLPRDNSSRVYRIPALVTADDGSLVAAADKRYDSHTDIGGGHVIDIVVRRSTDGGKTWSAPVVVAKGQGSSNDAKCGYGDPSLTKGKDGKLYCLFAAGNTGYFYGLNRICMSTSSDNGVTWTTPVDLYETGRITDHTEYGLYDYFVTSGKGLYTQDGVLMFLLPAQCYTNAEKTVHIKDYSNDYVFYSTDDGETWHIDATPVYTGGDEAKLQQLVDGTLIASIRQGQGRGFNFGTYVKNDDGTCSFTWGEQYQNNTLHNGGSANNQDILYYDYTAEGADVLFHTMTTGQHANLNLFLSIDGGKEWKQVLQIQPKGARYATTTKLANGDLGILFEDQALNAAGGSTDYNHYPLNFLTITKEQIEEWYKSEQEATEDMKNTAMIADGTNTQGPATYGDANSGTINNSLGLKKSTWTSNASSGYAGLTLTANHDAFMEETAYNAFHCLGFQPSAGGATDVVTITAPEGYLIKGYYMEAGFWTSGENYTLTATDGTGIKEYTTTGAPANGRPALDVTGIYKQSTTFSVKSLQSSNTRCLMINKFYVVLTQRYPVTLNVVGEKSYATLYLPFDVQTDADTKAYYASAAANGVITLADLNGSIAAKTAVVLINEQAATEATFSVATKLEQAVSEADNLLKGTLEAMTLDLGETTPYYSMGRKDDKIGFYKFDNNGTTTITLGANKAYLDTSAAAGQGKGFTFSFGDTDGIELVENKTGETSEQSADAVYNLSGQRVSRLSKGLYIKNGKKVVMK